MKKILKSSILKYCAIMVFGCSIHCNTLCAQITLDATIDSANLIYFFNTVQISDSETKYYIADTVNNVFNLYNMDFSPFLMNVTVPEPFVDGATVFRAIYVTRSLFDCDTSNIEYAFEAATNSTKTFYIMRTDGTQLFRLDSANAPYCFGDCLGGSDWVKPIISTSSGAKLFLQRPFGGGIRIYSLCGSLPTDVFNFTHNNKSYLNIFPNPASNSLTFEIHPPTNMDECELIILDNNAREVMRKKVSLGISRYTIDVNALDSGTYIYSLCTKNKAFQNGKFIINK